jgi:hypothetical protein
VERTDFVGWIAGVDGENGDGTIAFYDPREEGVRLSRQGKKHKADHFSTAYIW